VAHHVLCRQDGFSPLYVASARGHVEILALLLSAQPPAQVVSCAPCTP
jgi:hypothetical protein